MFRGFATVCSAVRKVPPPPSCRKRPLYVVWYEIEEEEEEDGRWFPYLTVLMVEMVCN